MLKNFNRSTRRYINEPYEKIYMNILLIFIFTGIYYVMYKNDKNSFLASELILMDRGEQELNIVDFFYYSIFLNFTITFGDIIPFSNKIKFLNMIHVISFWYITLF